MVWNYQKTGYKWRVIIIFVTLSLPVASLTLQTSLNHGSTFSDNIRHLLNRPLGTYENQRLWVNCETSIIMWKSSWRIVVDPKYGREWDASGPIFHTQPNPTQLIPWISLCPLAVRTVIIYCHFLQSPSVNISSSPVTVTDQITTLSVINHYWQTFHLWFSCFCTLPEIFFFIFAPWGTYVPFSQRTWLHP